MCRAGTEGFEKIKIYFEGETEKRGRGDRRDPEADRERIFFCGSGLWGQPGNGAFCIGLTQDDKAIDFLSVHESPLYLKWSEKTLV